ncbi:MAG: glycerophosphoryl diester phosphodiesterase [Gallionellaceae bacterium]|nr:MAG: glycerophosphoryl diester phosphodiesterase [Gallionellaceae bacterium]
MATPDRTLIFAHRGANQEAAENTRAAFDRALEHSVDGMETDIQLSRDEVAVLWHDRFLDKLGLPGKRIDDFDYAQLRAMNFAAHFSAASRPEGVVCLQEFLAAYRARCRLLLEIKNREWEEPSRHQTKVRQTLEMIAAATGDHILVSSFDLGSLVYAHRIGPQFPLVLNLEPEHGAGFARATLAEQPFLYGLCVHISTLDEAMVGSVRERGKRIAVYTCNSEEEIGRALGLGVDILISDVPQKALALKGAAPSGRRPAP